MTACAGYLASSAPCSQRVELMHLDITGDKVPWEVHYEENQLGECGAGQKNSSSARVSAEERRPRRELLHQENAKLEGTSTEFQDDSD